MTDTAFLRSDALPGRTATGYLEDGRTNVFSLPVVGFGDGGIYSTAPDFRKFWPALLDGRIVPARVGRPDAAPARGRVTASASGCRGPARCGSKAATTASRSGARTPAASPRP